jgi:hypothetical protein
MQRSLELPVLVPRAAPWMIGSRIIAHRLKIPQPPADDQVADFTFSIAARPRGPTPEL